MSKSKRVLDFTYKDWLKYYHTCKLKCTEGVYCPFKIGNCCLGDILQENNNKTLDNIISEVEDREVNIKDQQRALKEVLEND